MIHPGEHVMEFKKKLSLKPSEMGPLQLKVTISERRWRWNWRKVHLSIAHSNETNIFQISRDCENVFSFKKGKPGN